MQIIKYVLGLGSNIGDRSSHLQQAISRIDFLTDIKISTIYQSKALLPKDSDPSWDQDFLNLVLSGFSDLSPLQVLKACKQIESHMGRPLSAPRWSPRIIDIDILLAGALVIDHVEKDGSILCIPHKEMLNRNFVLLPAAAIEPTHIHPVTGKALKEYL